VIPSPLQEEWNEEERRQETGVRIQEPGEKRKGEYRGQNTEDRIQKIGVRSQETATTSKE
jgi:hypothetical protein